MGFYCIIRGLRDALTKTKRQSNLTKIIDIDIFLKPKQPGANPEFKIYKFILRFVFIVYKVLH